jgi:hypothetical protein
MAILLIFLQCKYARNVIRTVGSLYVYQGNDPIPYINQWRLHITINVIELDFIVLAHWNNSPRVDMSLHLDTLFWFRADHSLLFLINAACLAVKQQIPIL